MQLTRQGARQAQKTKAAGMYLQSFSKFWKAGTTYRVLYPVFYDEATGSWDIVTASVFGHRVDYRAFPSLGKIFVPTSCKLNEYGKPTGQPDLLYLFSRIAKAYHIADRDIEISNIEKNPQLQKTMKNSSIAAKMKEYDEEKSPVVGKLGYLTVTECLMIEQDKDGNPLIGDKCFTLASQELSDDKITKLLKILDDPEGKYTPGEGQFYLEVQYTFGSTGKKKVDGKVDPVGITSDYLLEKKYPQVRVAIDSLLNRMGKDTDTIKARNGCFEEADQNDILSALSMFAATNYDKLQFTDDTEMNKVKKARSLFEKLGVTPDGVIFDDVPVIEEVATDEIKATGASESIEDEDDKNSEVN